ncbi:GIY-YIG nuclease family protein [Candidatus Roizmanbacteria bacterium]|nr:GIY-YIG nuclease family protein [Candidatus Roizmanbacteria bacterium]
MDTDHLPTTTGIYLFKKADTFLYVGKSINIRARVRSHFENAKLDIKESLIVNNSDHIETIVTDSEFKALLLEAETIQKYHPKYNVIWKDNKSHLYIKITIRDKYPKVLLVRKPQIANVSKGNQNDRKSQYFGPYSSVRTTSMLLREIRKIIPFCTQIKLSNKPCFYSKIGLCNPCPNQIDVEGGEELKKAYRKNIRTIMRILKGNLDPVLKDFYMKLKLLTREKKYEEAITIRNKILRFEELLHSRQLPDDTYNQYNQSDKNISSLLSLLQEYFPKLLSLHRIECYDVSSLSQKTATASMVVLKNGLIQKMDYRNFKIKNTSLKSDFEMLEEVLKRRFNNRWERADLVIIDGGKPQLRKVLSVFQQLNITIPVVGIAKNPDRLIIKKENQFKSLRFTNTHRGFTIVRLIRDESHRFAHKYHLFLRDRNFLI